jgi:hypothetical protein
MPLIQGTIPSMIGGVSQQDTSVRQPSQLEECLNLNLSPARGAGPRPPARFVNVLGSDIPENAFWHSIIRDGNEHYFVCIYGNRVRVFDHVTGKEYVVVSDTPSLAYLSTQFDPCVSLRAVTIEDYTMIVNREVVVAMSTTVVPGGVVGSVQTFADLPKNAGYNAIWEVRGDATNSFDNYYVQASGAKVWNEVARPGVKNAFDATTMPHGLKRIPDSTNPDGFYFSYGPLDYDKRYAGDEKTCPPPSFVGQRIGGLSFHKDRFVILAGQNVVMSETGHYLNFWRTTITALLDSDTIDVAAPSEGVAQLTHAVSYLKCMLLFATGNTSMFQLTATPMLTPKTCKIDVVTTYQVSPYIKPVLSGASCFFVNDGTQHKWSTVREYFIQDDLVTAVAADVTAHVPSYIPGNTRCMAAAPDADMIFLAHRSPSGPQVYVHQFRWVGDEKQQSAWHPWKIEGTGAVVHMNAIGTDLYVIALAPGGGVELLTFDLSAAPAYAPVSSTFDIHLDRRELVNPTYVAFGNYTDITVPMILPSLKGIAVLKTTDWASPGSYLDTTKATLVNGGQTIRVPGNVAGGRVVVGYRYLRRATFSQQYVRDANNVCKQIGRLQLRRMTVRFNSAAFFRCLVYPKGRAAAIDTLVPQLTDTFTARTTGDAAFLLDSPSLQDGTHKFLVASRADQVHIALDSDTPYPCWWQSAQWEGTYTTQVRN